MAVEETYMNGIKVVHYTHSEDDFASEDTRIYRLGLCNTCEFSTNNGKCTKCTCLIQNIIKNKHMKCPEGKW